MLPGLRLFVAAFVASFVVITLGIDGLALLHVAQDRSAALPPPQARFAGLAFAERADWTPDATARGVSVELLPPFAKSPTTFQPPKFLLVKVEARAAVKSVPTHAAKPAPEAAKPASAAAIAKAAPPGATVAVAKPVAAPEPQIVVAIDPAPLDLSPGIAPSSVTKPSRSITTASAEPAASTASPVIAVPTAPQAAETPVVMPVADAPASPPVVDAKPAATAALEDVQLPLPRPIKLGALETKRPARAKPVRRTRPHREVRLERRPAVTRRRLPSYARKPAPAVAHKPAAPPAPTNPFAALFGARSSPATAK